MSVINKMDKIFEKKYKKFRKFIDSKINYKMEFDKENPNLLYLFNKGKMVLKAEFQFIGIFKEAENNFGYEPRLVSVAIRVFKRLNYLDIVLNYYKKLFEKKDITLSMFCSWIV